MTEQAMKLDRLDYVKSMSDEDWESWHTEMARRERLEALKAYNAANMTKEEKMAALYRYLSSAKAELAEKNKVVEQKLAKSGISIQDFVTYSINQERNNQP